MQSSRLELRGGPGGWVQAFTRTGTPKPLEPHETTWLRLAKLEETWEPTGEMFLPGVTPDDLRRVPLRRILLAVGANVPLRCELEARLDEVVPTLGTNDFYSSFTGYVHDELALERPAGRYLTDEFYEQVAATYRAAVEQGLRPRTAIAQAAGTSPEVAGRWVAEARKRGFLPKTQPGKVRA